MDTDLLELIINFTIPVVLLVLGLVIGRTAEHRHFIRLKKREAELGHIMICDLKSVPINWTPSQAWLVSGSVVIANDYFKSFVASIRNLFGGRMRSFESLLNRGRREAIVRMLEEAQDGAANAVWNVRIETSTIQGKRQKRAGGIELIAYGTALRVQ